MLQGGPKTLRGKPADHTPHSKRHVKPSHAPQHPRFHKARITHGNKATGPTILYYTTLYYTILYYTILYYTILYYTILYYTILYYTILYYTIPYYTILYYTILYYTILYYTILYYTILYYTILYYTILYYTILYYTILYYTILYYTIPYYTIPYYPILYHIILYYTALCYFHTLPVQDHMIKRLQKSDPTLSHKGGEDLGGTGVAPQRGVGARANCLLKGQPYRNSMGHRAWLP